MHVNRRAEFIVDLLRLKGELGKLAGFGLAHMGRFSRVADEEVVPHGLPSPRSTARKQEANLSKGILAKQGDSTETNEAENTK